MLGSSSRPDRHPAWLLPAPSDVAQSLVNDRHILLPNALITLEEVLIGFALALAAGVGLGIAVYRSALLARVLYPLIIASQTIPIPALAPLLLDLVWLRAGAQSARHGASRVLSRSSSIRSKDFAPPIRDVVNLLRSFGASGGRSSASRSFPRAYPSIFAGSKIAVAISVIGAVFGELVGAKAGLGYLMTRAIAQFETPRLLAAIVLLSLMGIGLFAAVGLIERLPCPGADTRRQSNRPTNSPRSTSACGRLRGHV